MWYSKKDMSDIPIGDMPWTMDPDLVIGEYNAVVANSSSSSLSSTHQWSRTPTGVRFIFCGVPVAAMLEADPVEGTDTWVCRIWFIPNSSGDPASVVLALTVTAAMEAPYCTVDITDFRGRKPETELEERAMRRRNPVDRERTRGEAVYRAIYVMLERQHALYETELLRLCAPGFIVHRMESDGYLRLEGRWHGYKTNFVYHRRSILYLEISGDNDGENLMWKVRLERTRESPTMLDGHILPLESRKVLDRLEHDEDVEERVNERDLTYLIAGCARLLEHVPFTYRFFLTEFTENVPLLEPVTYVHNVSAYTFEEAQETMAAIAADSPDLAFDATPAELDPRTFPVVMPVFAVTLPD